MKIKKLYLVLILLFVFAIRVWSLWHPRTHIFDEVYCSFTAQEIAKGNPKAWEWWASPPKGFAYGWTHPYLAKLIMASGVLIFGESQFAFRFPAALFGTGVIYLIYLLAKQIFKDEKIAFLSIFIASFDGLLFVMSRTGMLDIFLLFFLLAAIFFTLKEKYLWSGIFLGFSIATKWTGIYLYPVIGVVLLAVFITKTKRTHKSIVQWSSGLMVQWVLAFVLIPIAVYLFSYTLFFTSGHTFAQFIGLQKQMWWYHTNLEATHSYQSKAWTWPLMLRPVWFWVDYQKNKVANIYNRGNPVIWWSGLAVLPLAVYQAIKELKKEGTFSLGFVIFCYFAFWLPWIFSPRIMFLHHYMPAIPFLCILIAWFLNKLVSGKWQVATLKISGKLVAGCWLLVAIIIFLLFYPIYTGISIPQNYFKLLLWLPSWK